MQIPSPYQNIVPVCGPVGKHLRAKRKNVLETQVPVVLEQQMI